MSMTPGPWEAEKNGEHWTVRAPLEEYENGSFELCKMSGNRDDEGDNARAIAAVPEMIAHVMSVDDFLVDILESLDEGNVMEFRAKASSLSVRSGQLMKRIEEEEAE